MDSACSYHMTPNKDWFDTYMLVNFGSILMGNDALCRVVGMGSIKVKMFDCVIRMLCDVRHVPNLRKNLISFGTLDGNGFNYKSANGVMKVSKGVLTMTEGQKMARNINKLMGTIIVGGVATVEPELNSTTLWHMRLVKGFEGGISCQKQRKTIMIVENLHLGTKKQFRDFETFNSRLPIIMFP